ncbi:MAG: hypothetical protein CVV27_00735 [Candidatus Melainabacteria bacterium HGW-Melainabacteria-1]|nr:MAG: hypothetical protein CVV27_00735 [Candidatus Melainabacteria bacterium HGW-Melainabacteria-1]
MLTRALTDEVPDRDGSRFLQAEWGLGLQQDGLKVLPRPREPVLCLHRDLVDKRMHSVPGSTLSITHKF